MSRKIPLYSKDLFDRLPGKMEGKGDKNDK
jgi:hypothetical protein